MFTYFAVSVTVWVAALLKSFRDPSDLLTGVALSSMVYFEESAEWRSERSLKTMPNLKTM